MDTIRNQMKNPIIVGAAGLILGIILGLLYGWVINPVEWVDANPEALSPTYQDEYLRMAIYTFGATGDVDQAQQHYRDLGESADDALQRVMAQPDGLDPELIASYATIVTGTAVAPVPVDTTLPGATTLPTLPGTTPLPGTLPAVETSSAPVVVPGAENETLPGTEPAEEEGGSNIVTILIALICVVLLAIGATVAYLLLRGRMPRMSVPGTSTPAQAAAEARRQTAMTDYAAGGTEPPVAQFMASYKIGDDLFDDSFSIDSPTGEFLGECGVGISDTIGVGEPKKVSAFEVWLFDKNDIQTVTKVVMSMHAFFDEASRQRLEAKGEQIQAEPGSEFSLETQTLHMVATIVDMSYGESAMPPQSYFDHLLLELAIWAK